MAATKGWLKPKLLKEITGTPAQELVAKEIREQKQERKKKDFLKRYNSKLLSLGGKNLEH